MKKITKKSLWKAFKWLVLLSACTHLVLLFISFLRTQDITLINYFDIIDLDLFVPNIENGVVSQIFSIGIIMALDQKKVTHILSSYDPIQQNISSRT